MKPENRKDALEKKLRSSPGRDHFVDAFKRFREQRQKEKEPEEPYELLFRDFQRNKFEIRLYSGKRLSLVWERTRQTDIVSSVPASFSRWDLPLYKNEIEAAITGQKLDPEPFLQYCLALSLPEDLRDREFSVKIPSVDMRVVDFKLLKKSGDAVFVYSRIVYYDGGLFYNSECVPAVFFSEKDLAGLSRYLAEKYELFGIREENVLHDREMRELFGSF